MTVTTSVRDRKASTARVMTGLPWRIASSLFPPKRRERPAAGRTTASMAWGSGVYFWSFAFLWRLGVGHSAEDHSAC